MVGRAWRRHQEERIKERMRRFYPEQADDEETIGFLASTHGKPCSCPMCGNPRRHFGHVTRQEKLAQE